MRVGLAIAIIASASMAVAAPRVVRGVVTDRETGRAVVGATIFTERGEVAVSDNDGYFSLDLGDSARGELTIAAPGFGTQTVHADASEQLVRIELAPVRGGEV